MTRNVIETVMGAMVLVIAALFLFFAYSTSQVRSVRGYEVTAKFDRIEGVREGSDVRISGIKVGSIVSENLDATNYLAVVRISIDPKIKLPTDTIAQIASSGLLGDKYMSLLPGAADDTIPPGGQIKYTQAPVSLENMIGQYIFSQQGQKKNDQDSGAAAAPSAPPTPPASPSTGK
ncbi:MAG TPA: outer membrane lipid asymmetry maintenance protein MlaD [Stellaceae bacterium]|jgi:phospholipid/cholesterol/gamma-HCH transport system substrate-binding protein